MNNLREIAVPGLFKGRFGEYPPDIIESDENGISFQFGFTWLLLQ